MQTGLKLIGLAGTNGSGKDTVGTVLADQYGYWFISVTDLLREECRKRSLPVTRENLRAISAEWRRQHGLAVLVDRAVEAYKAAGGDKTHAGLVMASFRNPAEADRLHELGGKVIWVDADPRVRYERVQANAVHRGRAEEDVKTFEQFLAEQEAEMHPPEGSDAAVLNMSAVKERADTTLENNSDSLDTFRRDIESALGLV
jgi:dephospho-CoA kinase